MKTLKILFLLIPFTFLACQKDDDNGPNGNNGTSNFVEVKANFSFNYANSDVEISEVTIYLRMANNDLVIAQTSKTIDGRPSNLDLSLKLSEETAQSLLLKTAELTAVIKTKEGNFNNQQEEKKTFTLSKGLNTVNFNISIASPASKAIITVKANFKYNSGSTILHELNIRLIYDFDSLTNPILSKTLTLNDRPDQLIESLILEGDLANEHIGKERVIWVSAVFRLHSTYYFYTEYETFILKAGEQNFEFDFEH